MIKLCTDNPVAYESADYKEPFGCKYNNSTNELFNKKLYELKPSKPLYILDLGCAGGGFIKDCIDDGHIAFGIDGSDYAKINGLGEWKNIPESLDTADITKHFYFTGEITRNNINFDVITMWDVLEHIKPCDIHSVLDNIVYNIKQDGCVICSINVASKAHADSIHGKDWGDGMHHQNVQPPEYWDNLFFDIEVAKRPIINF